MLLLATAPLLGCVNTDAAVFVAPTLSSPAATVTSSVLGTGVTGGAFSLDLHLGARASGPSTVTLGAFSILDAEEMNSIVSPLSVQTDTTFPATVQPDSDVTASFQFDTGAKLFPTAVGAQLCASAGVVIGGIIDDSLAGRSTPVYSDVFHPSGCP